MTGSRRSDQECQKVQILFFVHPCTIHKAQKSTYIKLIASLQPLNPEIPLVQVTAGGDKFDYNRKTSSYPARLVTIKIYINSTISTYRVRYITLDIKYFYYITPTGQYKYKYI